MIRRGVTRRAIFAKCISTQINSRGTPNGPINRDWYAICGSDGGGIQMKRLIFAPLFVLMLGVAAFGQGAVAKAQRVTGDRFTVSATTPKGASVLAVRRPSA